MAQETSGRVSRKAAEVTVAKLVSAKDLANHLGLQVKTVLKWARAGTGDNRRQQLAIADAIRR